MKRLFGAEPMRILGAVAKAFLLLIFATGALCSLGGAVIDFRAHNWFFFFPEAFTAFALILFIHNSGVGATLKQLATGAAALAGFWAFLWWVLKPLAEEVVTLVINFPLLWQAFIHLPGWEIFVILLVLYMFGSLLFEWLVLYPIVALIALGNWVVLSVWMPSKNIREVKS